jgi:uncharacterized protein (TIGR02145 family)
MLEIMNNRQGFSIYPVMLMGLFVVFANSCEKIDDNESLLNNLFNGKTTALFNSDITYGTMTDQEGNVYKTVTIGTQTWMAENLRTTIYNDGTFLTNVADDDEWEDLTTGAYCNYDNATGTDTIATYGRLYNWYAVNTGKLTPVGWHVPTDAEWTTLSTYLGGESVAGDLLKETTTKHWSDSNIEATNETGFTALPGGYRSENGNFYYIGYFGSWWSSTEYLTGKPYFRAVYFDDGEVIRSFSRNMKLGVSIRCVMD